MRGNKKQGIKKYSSSTLTSASTLFLLLTPPALRNYPLGTESTVIGHPFPYSHSIVAGGLLLMS
jgi:hypothetical protein